MDIKVEEKDGILHCLKHNEKITMFITDRSVPFKDSLLCSQCLLKSNIFMAEIIPLSKAKQMIKSQGGFLDDNLNQKTQSLIDDLKSFFDQLVTFRKQVRLTFDNIMRIMQQWIKDLDFTKIANNLLQQLYELHEQNQSPLNIELRIENINNVHSNKLTIMCQQLQNQVELFRCVQLENFFLNKSWTKSQQEIQHKPLIHRMRPEKLCQISSFNSKGFCSALAFNQVGSIMVSGCKCNIKVWSFQKGKLSKLKTLTEHCDYVYCLVFSKKLNWFASGSRDLTIRGWKEEENNWISSQPQKHLNFVYCLLLSGHENELISCSADKTIKVWSVNCFKNLIQFSYTLEQKHTNEVHSISFNESETALVSGSLDNSIILWMKGSNEKWKYINRIEGQVGLRIGFVSDTKFFFQPITLSETKIFEIQNQQILESPTKINLEYANNDSYLFPTIYNQKRQIIIQKHYQYVYLIAKQDATFKIILEPIDCSSYYNYGALTDDGQFLVIWNLGTEEFKVYEIYY